MRTFVVGEDTGRQAVLDKLLLANVSATRRDAAVKALETLNPHVDLGDLAPGAVLFLPDVPGFRASVGRSNADLPTDPLVDLLKTATQTAVADTAAANARLGAEQAEVVRAFGSSAVKRAAAGDAAGKEIATRIDAITKSFEADRDQGAETEQAIAAIAETALAKLTALRKLFQ